MTNQEILEKTIKKAIDGGYNFQEMPGEIGDLWLNKMDEWQIEWKTDQYTWNYSVTGLIFSHDFAKALWGEEEHGTDGAKWGTVDDCTRCGMIDHEYSTMYCWQYHLQQIVIADDPIKYLGENI